MHTESLHRPGQWSKDTGRKVLSPVPLESLFHFLSTHPYMCVATSYIKEWQWFSDARASHTPLLSWTRYIAWEQITPLWDPAINCCPTRKPHLPLTLTVIWRHCRSWVARLQVAGSGHPLLIFSDPRRLWVWKEEQKPQANLCGS